MAIPRTMTRTVHSLNRIFHRHSFDMVATFKDSEMVLTTFKAWVSRFVDWVSKTTDMFANQWQVIYLAGSPHINEPWAADGYSPLDFTLLDHHFGTIAEWQDAIAEVHRRGMYVLMDNTMST